ncbi:MbtH family NRPS accessory protein [Streptomyces sp. ISL-1]|uniref:MbtH family protein n=1 Tax=Streptomyces sp. ISL-1 TaxID=2817657 RepID=UPI001BE82EC8|nr:MbtH family NRPS accessory protein [Streptomyces sp. ISL-1]MBT2393894.1 MbtH family NRPS accessory protein [Streptomyces sp. ISL-1]
MALNPFEADISGKFIVLINDENQHSLWPSWVPVPAGWKSVSEGSRESCGAYIESHWTDMRPTSLINSRNS